MVAKSVAYKQAFGLFLIYPSVTINLFLTKRAKMGRAERKASLQASKIHGLVDRYIEKFFPDLRKQHPISLIFVFIDGFGIAPKEQSFNPVKEFGKEIFSALSFATKELPYRGILVPTDPLLHTPGLPQSATGQTALLTGIDAVRFEGRHIPALPTTKLRKIIAEYSIFKRLRDKGSLATFANGFTDHFFEGKRRFHSTSTLSYFASQLPFRSLNDVRSGQSLFMDINNRLARKMGIAVPLFSYEESADALIHLASRYDFIFYEYFLTDKAGHSLKKGLVRRSIEHIERLLIQLLRKVDLSTTQIVVSSDHGNVENISTHTHTRNFVPTMLWGPQSEFVYKDIHDLVDVHRAMCRILDLDYPEKILHSL